MSFGIELTLPNDKSLDSSKLKAFADDNMNVSKNIGLPYERVESIVRKRENAEYQHFSLFLQCFKRFVFRVVKSWNCVVKSEFQNLKKKILSVEDTFCASIR